MSDDVEFLANYKPNTLYIHPAKNGKGAYASLLSENEVQFAEIEVTDRFRVAVSAFYVSDKEDFNSFKITKLKYHKTHGWQLDGEVKVNNFQIAKMKEFVSVISSLNLKSASKTKITLGDTHIDTLGAILNTDKGGELLKKIAESPELSEDIFALAHKKLELETFRKLLFEYEDIREIYIEEHRLKQTGEEEIWQHFFENNQWIFGHGLNYLFLHNTGKKLESTTTGYTHVKSGNRVDALMRTKAVISQYVLIEIKKPSSNLLQQREYRSGCWTTSTELTDAVSQVQKTVFDFVSNQGPKDQIKNGDGKNVGGEIFKIQPRSYLIIGNLSELKDYDEKFTCFQLFRNSLISPEILTYDELFERANCIVETISKKEKK
jgi:Shedu protein SduA, C-terminal